MELIGEVHYQTVDATQNLFTIFISVSFSHLQIVGLVYKVASLLFLTIMIYTCRNNLAQVIIFDSTHFHTGSLCHGPL